MDDANFGLIELILVFGGLLGWATWELVRNRRALERLKRERQSDAGR